MFMTLKFTVINEDIRTGIPKIDGASQATALRILNLRWGRFDQVVHSIKRIKLVETVDVDDGVVFVGGTAYNFLNVFLKPPQELLQGGVILTGVASTLRTF